MMRTLFFTVFLLGLLSGTKAFAQDDLPGRPVNGFVLSDLLIPLADIHSGGPPRDGIPAIDRPDFSRTEAVEFLQGEDRVLGVVHNGVAKAYPIRIMNYHEIVNDDFAGERVVVTYCPLCGSGMSFLATIDGKPRTFGVSGLLYNSDVLLYDRETESLWSQIMSKSISGSSSGQELTFIATQLTSWTQWKVDHPNTLVLNTKTGHARDYNKTPYEGYADYPDIWFPVSHQSTKLGNKEFVAGIEVGGQFKAYPLRQLGRAKMETITDTFNDQELMIHFNKEARSVQFTTESGEEWPAVTLYWFAWYTFHPDTEVYRFKRR